MNLTLDDGVYKNRKKSALVKWLFNHSYFASYSELSSIMELSLPYFHNKLNRNSFSFEDILLISELCGFTVSLVNNETGEIYKINLNEFFSEENFERLCKQVYEAKREEYNSLKKELERMNQLYGFDKTRKE